MLQVPCVAVVENMSYFEVDGVRHLPFGAGSGDRIVRDFGLPNLIRFPIVADLSAAGDGESNHLLELSATALPPLAILLMLSKHSTSVQEMTT